MIKVELTRREMNLIIIGMTSGTNYPIDMQREAFDLILKLRDIIRDTKLD